MTEPNAEVSDTRLREVALEIAALWTLGAPRHALVNDIMAILARRAPVPSEPQTAREKAHADRVALIAELREQPNDDEAVQLIIRALLFLFAEEPHR